MSELRLPNLVNVPFVEGLYEDYRRDPASVAQEWRTYFHQLDNGGETPSERGSRSERTPLRSSSVPPDGIRRQTRGFGAQDRVDQLIRVYRMRGHIIAQIDPL